MEESPGLTPGVRRGSQAGDKGTDIRKSNRLLFLLLSALILLLIAGIALLAAYFLLQRQAAVTMPAGDPVAVVQADAVAPDLAVLTLAGEGDDRVVRAALDASEAETAYAALAYAVLLPDNVRSGHWLLLADHYRSQGNATRLVGAYQALLDQAALAPGLSDTTRAELSLQAARGMAALGKMTIARLALTQAENVARYSVVLLPAQRRSILEQVADSYRKFGDTQTAVTLQAQLAAASAGPGIKLAAPIDILGQLRGSVVLPAAVVAAAQARQGAAAAMGARWLAADSAGRSALASSLGDALQAEDSARSDFYAGLSALSGADQLAMLHDEVAWLTVKYRAARGAYGTSLVSAWEGQSGQIQADLAAAYTELINAYGRQLATLEPGMADQGRMQLLQQALLWVRLGLFPDHAEASLSKQLIEAAQQMWTRRGGAGLVVVAQDVQGQPYYLLAGSSTAK